MYIVLLFLLKIGTSLGSQNTTFTHLPFINIFFQFFKVVDFLINAAPGGVVHRVPALSNEVPVYTHTYLAFPIENHVSAI